MRNNGQPVRDAILAALAIVTHYEDKTTGNKASLNEAQRLPRNSLRSVGLPYCECLELVKERVPWSKTNGPVLRWTAHQVRIGAPGFEGHELPQRRPHGKRRAPDTANQARTSVGTADRTRLSASPEV